MRWQVSDSLTVGALPECTHRSAFRLSHLDQATHAPLGKVFRGNGQVATSFIMDCSFKTPFGSSPECRKLRDAFIGKEVIGSKIKTGITCGYPSEYRNPRQPHRLPRQREEFIHESQTDLWYHCCEKRGPWQRFSIDAPEPYVAKNSMMDMLANSLSSLTGGFLAGAQKGIKDQDESETWEGPLLQCNVMENMKHRLEDDTGGRMVVDKASPGALAALTGLSHVMCEGDQAVALQNFAGGSKSRTFADNLAECVDAGGHGDPTPFGKPYHVFELSAPRSFIDVSIAATTTPIGAVSGDCRKRRRNVARFL